MNVVDSIEDAVTRSVESSGDPAVAVIPEGPYVVPRFAAEVVREWAEQNQERIDKR